MSKRLVIFIYVVAVLIFSGYIAKADEMTEDVNVARAKIDQQTGTLLMGGQLSNTCLVNPNAAIQKVEGNFIVFSVTASQGDQRCSDQLGAPYVVSVDLKELPLVEGKEYVVFINNYSGPRVHLSFVALKNPGFLQVEGQAQHSQTGIVKVRDSIMN